MVFHSIKYHQNFYTKDCCSKLCNHIILVWQNVLCYYWDIYHKGYLLWLKCTLYTYYFHKYFSNRYSILFFQNIFIDDLFICILELKFRIGFYLEISTVLDLKDYILNKVHSHYYILDKSTNLMHPSYSYHILKDRVSNIEYLSYLYSNLIHLFSSFLCQDILILNKL